MTLSNDILNAEQKKILFYKVVATKLCESRTKCKTNCKWSGVE